MMIDKEEYKKKVLGYVEKFIDSTVDLEGDSSHNFILTLDTTGCFEVRNQATNTIHSSGFPGSFDPIECSEGWYYKGKLHRESGPAIVDNHGYQCWYFNGMKHRADGPAVIYSDGEMEWWYMDEEMHPDDWFENHPDKELAAIAKLAYDTKENQ